MNSRQKLTFLRAKLKAMESHFGKPLIEHFSLVLDRVEADSNTIPASAYNDIDGEFEQLLLGHVATDQVAQIRHLLIDQCGQDSLGNPPDKVIRTVLKRRRITGELEAKTVGDYLSGDYRGLVLNSSEVAALTEILGAYERSV